MNIIQIPSPNFNERKSSEISFIILHYTGMKSAQDAMARLCDPKAEVSAHYTIDEDGAVYQHVQEDKRAWHAGRSAWKNYSDLNSLSVGVEIVNLGHEFGYKEFTESQIKAVMGLCKAIQDRHNIRYVLGHSDIAPDRKEDPGELFPWQRLAKEGIGFWPAVADEDVVKASVIDVITALKDFGYRSDDDEKLITAFQRHFVPEAFEKGTEGQICNLTKSRLYALLAEHLIS